MNRYLVSALALVALAVATWAVAPSVQHSKVGERVQSEDGKFAITCANKIQNFSYADRETYDPDINSPKSVNYHPDGSKFYVNSLEGCATVVYDKNGKKIKVIHHEFTSGTGALWGTPNGVYKFTHYEDGVSRAFSGKPVESTFSHGGRYLWVPYYRRTFDTNAQDPSAVAVIDTRSDSIVRMMDTGPLPKMIACSHDGRLVAVTHWGNNTVGLIDISGDDPMKWHNLPYVVVEKELKLDYSLTVSTNRDTGSGLMLRGTVFTPDDRYLIIGCMGGGGLAVIDVARREYVGMIKGVVNARHLVIDHGYLYASLNTAGIVQRVPLDSVIRAIDSRTDKAITLETDWQTCKVGGGARTIELSPSGRYLFAACNSASALFAVDTRSMTVVAQIPVDSYPVGLDISHDGKTVIVTSQGRDHQGGNAVNIYNVDYPDNSEQQAYEQEQQRQAQAEREAAEKEAQAQAAGTSTNSTMLWAILGGVGLIALLAAIFYFINRRKR